MKFALVLLSLTAGLSAATSPAPPDAQRLFRVRCGGCHGADGAGASGPSLRTKLTHSSSKQLFEVIKNGIPGTAMPPANLSDPVVQRLVLYVQSINKKK